METLFIGQRRFDVATSPSTNSWALQTIRDQKVQEGTLFTTSDQTAGRGQRGNTWEASPGKNLTISIVLHPSWLEPSEQFYLSQLVSLAVAATVEEILPEKFASEIRVKWPNDIFVGEKKIGGILIENIIREGMLAVSIAGIGLNVNQGIFESAPRAVSLLQVLGYETDTENCLSRVCKQIEWRYLQLKTGKKKELRNEYLEKLFGLNETRTYCVDGESISGILRGVTVSGLLILELPGGHQRTFDFKELKFVL
jgi:BirA family biotin operon repressor/biotin-[acetyl-CoA-carboxylase] ligase